MTKNISLKNPRKTSLTTQKIWKAKHIQKSVKQTTNDTTEQNCCGFTFFSSLTFTTIQLLKKESKIAEQREKIC